MPNWEHVIAHVANDVEQEYDKLKYRLLRKLNPDPIVIIPYIGHGTRRMLYLKGRVMEQPGFKTARDNDTIWHNLVNMYRRFETDEIPRAEIRARYGDHEVTVRSDEEGFFIVQIEPDEDLPADTLWYDIELELLDFPTRKAGYKPVKTFGQVIVPPPNAQFGVISDMDDTVIQSDVLNLIKLARNTFLQNSRTRLPFEGVAAFYRALQTGTNGSYNPLFYLSSSPWNLYDLFVDFFEVREIPIGPFLLTDMGLTDDHLVKPTPEAHKLHLCNYLLATHPTLPYILIGDSGEHDPEIYTKVALENPGRVKAIYIRDVNQKADRDREVIDLAEKLKEVGTDLLLVPDTVTAAEHAVMKGFILEEAMLDIRIERTEDKKPPEPLEVLLDPTATPEKLEQKMDEKVEEEALKEELKNPKDTSEQSPPA